VASVQRPANDRPKIDWCRSRRSPSLPPCHPMNSFPTCILTEYDEFAMNYRARTEKRARNRAIGSSLLSCAGFPALIALSESAPCQPPSTAVALLGLCFARLFRHSRPSPEKVARTLRTKQSIAPRGRRSSSCAPRAPPPSFLALNARVARAPACPGSAGRLATPQIAQLPKHSPTAGTTSCWGRSSPLVCAALSPGLVLETIRGAHTPAVRLGEGQGRKALLDVLLEKFGDPGMAYAPAGRQLPSVPSSHS
jgi:hypothetical protein